MRIKKIESDKNKFVKWIQLLMNKSRERNKEHVYIVEGFKAVYELKPSRIHTLIVTNMDFLEKISYHNDLFEIIEMPMSVFKKMSQDKTPQGIMAVVYERVQEPLEEILQRNGLYLALDNIQDPGNLGTMIRVCDAVNVTAMFISKESVDPYHPKVTKGSMGSIERVPIYIVESLSEILNQMNGLGIQTLGAYLEESQYHFDYDYNQGTCFVIGNEGNGIRDEVINSCSKRVKIPMPGGSESLNAGVAASVLLYEALRQRMK